MLIGLGASQMALGWIGQTFAMKYLYPLPLIALGVGALWAAVRRLQGKPVFPSEIAMQRKDRALATLHGLWTGAYGAFVLNDDLRRDLIYWISRGYITTTVPFERLPEQGEELCQYVTLMPELKAYFDAAMQEQ
jgi:hypothetical protein